MPPFPYPGETALITGASSGIGAAFARELAARGMHLVLVARSEDKLNTLADSIRAEHGVTVTVAPRDLVAPGAVDELKKEVAAAGVPIALLVNNAGFGSMGAFVELPPERIRAEIDLDVTILVGLTRAFAPEMIERGGGGILNIASVAAFTPLPYMAVYGASKAFVRSFSEAIHVELAPRNVRVVAVCPGPTDTGFFDAAEATGLAAASGRLRTPEQVVQSALHALDRNKSLVIDGGQNTVMARVSGAMPGLAAKLSGPFLRRMTEQSTTEPEHATPNGARPDQ